MMATTDLSNSTQLLHEFKKKAEARYWLARLTEIDKNKLKLVTLISNTNLLIKHAGQN